MRKTLFSGLTQLDPLDPLSTDNYSFQAVNPDIEDRLLEVGAVTHRHDNHPALADPVPSPSCASGIAVGQIPGGVTFEFAYTLLDADRGETLESPICSVTTPDLLSAPTSAPDGTADYTAGSLSGDAYYYAATWVDAGGGETTLGAIEAVDVDPATNARVLLSGLTVDMPAGAVAWKLYRARGGEAFHYLASGATDTLIDDGTLCASCQVFPPTVNTTTQNSSLEITVPALPSSAAVGWKLYGRSASAEWPINSYIASGTGAALVSLTSFAPTYGRPPARSLALRGAHQIDPDTELLDWHWKRPVGMQTSLPTGELGDVRLVESDGSLWAVLASGGALDYTGWVHLASGGAGGGSIRQVAASGDGQALDPAAVVFVGSGSIGIAVTSQGGSAIVRIGDTPYTGIGVRDEDGPQFSGMDALEFYASGAASVGVSDVGGGSARVTVHSTPGATGATGPAGSGAFSVTDSDGPIFHGKQHLEFVGSGGIGLEVTDLGGGSARVVASAAPNAYARVERTSTQAITNSTDTAISFSSATEFGADLWDAGAPTRITIPTPGLYLVVAQVNWVASNVGYRWLHFRKNGLGGGQGENKGTKFINPGAGIIAGQGVTLLQRFVAGDYLEVYVRQNSGGNLGFDSAEGQFATVEVTKLSN